MIIGDGIMLGSGGESASIFVTGPSETDNVSATHKVPNPEWKSLPDSYTQLEYIESTGTQYIQVPAPTVANGFIVEFSFYSGSQPSGYYPLFVSFGSNGFWLGWLNGSFIVRMADNKDVITTSFTTNKWIDAKVVYDGSTVKLFFDGNQVGSATATFANGGVNTYFCYDTANKTSFRLGEFEFSVGDTVNYHYVPCKNGSGSVGLYDLVTNTFYGNAGTGTFVAGAEVPQYMDGYADGKTIAGKWTQKLNPAYVALPDGYTQLEYIESTGTQYLKIPTPTVSNGFDIEFSLYSAQQSSGFQPLFVSSIDYGLWIGWYNGSFIIRTFNHDNIITVSYPYDTFVNVRVVYNESTVELYFDNVKVGSGSASFADGASNMFIFSDGVGKTSCKLGVFRFNVGNAVTYHYIPASNSSNIIGLYDLVNDAFYTNAGTGAFTAGPEIPQTIDGFLIEKIKDYGTWTVTATDGTNTATQDVLVDSAMQYDIKMFYGLKIYWDGDAYQPVTAFDLYDARQGTPSVSTSFETDCVRVKQNLANTVSGICSVNSIDLSQYSKLSIEWSKTSAVNTIYSKVRAELYGQNYSGINVGVNSSGTPLDNQIVNIGVSDDYYTDYTGTHHVTEFDLSGFDQTGYIASCFWYTADAKIYKVWLE